MNVDIINRDEADMNNQASHKKNNLSGEVHINFFLNLDQILNSTLYK